MTTWAAIAALLAVAQEPARQEAEARLRSLKVSLDFKDAPLESVVDYLRTVSDLNILLDSKVREKNPTVTLRVQDVSLKSALNLILRPLGCDTMFRDGVLMIMTREDVADRTLVLELYDCRDLLHPVKDFPGVDFELAPNGQGVVPFQEAGEGPAEMPIEELVRAHTGGRSWEENPRCTVSLRNGILVVRNTPEVHHQVRRLLNLLRRHR
jgi:type II secretory pathway component GspD/PulD (secretin)